MGHGRALYLAVCGLTSKGSISPDGVLGAAGSCWLYLERPLLKSDC